MQHKVKIWPEFYADVVTGARNFELRRNDRKYAIGDILILQEFEPRIAAYTGRECVRYITYVLDGVGQGCIAPLMGLNRGYCILGLRAPDLRQAESLLARKDSPLPPPDTTKSPFVEMREFQKRLSPDRTVRAPGDV